MKMSEEDRLDKSGDDEVLKMPDNARRALAEAEERRQNSKITELEKEYNGRKGLDPVRYGDWEKKGLAVDF